MIERPDPYVIPARKEESFPGLWMSTLVIGTPSLDTAYLSVELLPYRPESGEEPAAIGPAAGVITLREDSLFEAVADPECPNVQLAYQYIMAAMPELLARHLRRQAGSAPAPE